MSDEKTTADQPTVLQVEMDQATLLALGALMAPVTLWARAQGAPDPGPADVIGLALRLLAAQVGERSNEKIAEAGEVAPTAMH